MHIFITCILFQHRYVIQYECFAPNPSDRLPLIRVMFSVIFLLLRLPGLTRRPVYPAYSDFLFPGIVMTVLWVAMMLALGVAIVRAQGSGDLPPMKYSHRVVLDQDGVYVMLWTPHDHIIEIEVQVSARKTE